MVLSIQYCVQLIEKKLKMMATDCSYLYEREMMTGGAKQDWCQVVVLLQRFCLRPVRKVANKSTHIELMLVAQSTKIDDSERGLMRAWS